MTDYVIEPIEWAVHDPGRPEPIGRIRVRGGAFHAKLEAEYLGAYPSGDRAAEAVWRRYCDYAAARHAHAAVTHGSRERHV